jgi:hypothetical protein
MFEFLVSLDWSKIGGVVSSVTSLVTMSIALIALGTWKRTMRNQRIDECISAAYDLRGEIGDWVTIIHQARSSSIEGLAQGPVFTEAFEQMLRRLRDFERSYRIALRYRRDLDPKALYGVRKILIYLHTDRPDMPPIERQAGGAIDNLDEVIQRLERSRLA